MKKTATLFLTLIVCCGIASGQYFSDNFESYSTPAKLGPQSTTWTTWSAADGGSEDCDVVTTLAHSGTKSIYFISPGGNGPHDVVLPFGGVNSSGRFKFTAWFFVPTNKAAYFNFQAGAAVGQQWAMELYMRTSGNININGLSSGSFNTTYPQNKWFEMIIDADLTNDRWEIFIDGVSKGTFVNSFNISYLDLFEADALSEFWVDDISYCINSACNPEIEMQSVSVSPNPVCTHQKANVTVKLKNNGPITAPKMKLGVTVGSNVMTHDLVLNNLAVGKDTTITIPNLFVSTTAGTNLTVKATNLDGDLVPANDVANGLVTVSPSPSNTAITKATPFVTTRPLSAGTSIDPDIVAAKDALNYEITPPTGFSNSNHGTLWEITGFTVRSKNGVLITTNYTYTPPVGGTNAKFSFTPDSLLNDSGIVITFTVRDKNNLCDSSLSRYIYVAPRPKAGYSTVNVCDKQQMIFTNSSSIMKGTISHLWDFGDGTTSVLTQPGKTYAAPGTYNVKLVVTSDYDYKDSMMQTVTVYQIPKADFKFVNACAGTAVTFADNSVLPAGTPTFAWEFGDATTGSGATTSRLYASPGIYNAKLTVTVNGCSSTATRFVTQAPRAVPNFNFTATQCDNGVVDFTNTSTDPAFGTVSYLWRFGDGNESTEGIVNHTYNNFQTYNVVLVGSTDLGCKDSITKTVTLRQSPTADFSYSVAKCINVPINFTNASVIPTTGTNSYEWDFGDGNQSTSSDPTHQYSGPGTYKITLKSFSTNGCQSSKDATVTVDLTPVADFAVQDVCEGTTSIFGNSSIAQDNSTLTYKWMFGNGDSSSVESPTLKYTTAGTYNVSLTATHSNGCASTKSLQTIVNPTPVPAILLASKLSQDGSFNFTTTTTGTGYVYYWLFGDGGSSHSKDTSYHYLADGLKHISLKITTPQGCEGTSTQDIFVNRLSVKDLSGLDGKVNVYPNPSAGRFVIDLSAANSNDVAGITVTDMLGRTVATNVAVSAAGIAEVDLSGQAAGIYYLNITNSNGTHTVKLNVSR